MSTQSILEIPVKRINLLKINNHVDMLEIVWKKCSGLQCDRRMPMKLKGKVYKTVIRPAMLYGADTWATTKRQEKRIEMTEMRMLRWMCGVTCKDKIRNEHIRGTTRVAQASKKITERRLNWYRNVMRRDGEHILRKVLRADTPGKRKRGQPKTRWKDACQRDLKSTGQRERARRRTGRCGEERSSVIPATLHDGKSQRKRRRRRYARDSLTRQKKESVATWTQSIR